MTLVPWLARLAITAWVLSSLTSCESGIQPQPEPKYLLYAAMQGSTEGWIAVIDCTADTLIDSIGRGFYNPPGIVASPDGKYFAVLGSGRPPELFDAITRSQIKYLSAPALGVLFLPSAQIVLSPTFDSTIVYQIPGFARKEVWVRPRWLIEPVGSSGRIGSADHQHDSMPHPSLSYVIYSADGNPVDSLVINPDSANRLEIGRASTFSPDGTRFYGTVFGSGVPMSLAGRDLNSERLLFLQATQDHPQFCRVSPDGREVWTTDPGDLSGYNPTHKGSVRVYDAASGVLKDSVSLAWTHGGAGRTLSPGSIRFLPNTDKVYICSVGGPIMVVNGHTKMLEGLIFPEFNQHAEEIDLSPQP